MDIETFYKHLRELRAKGYVAYINSPDSALRLRHPATKNCFCPITAVCHALTGKAYLPAQYEFAAQDIGLDDHREAYWISQAADGVNTYHGVRRMMLEELELMEVL